MWMGTDTPFSTLSRYRVRHNLCTPKNYPLSGEGVTGSVNIVSSTRTWTSKRVFRPQKIRAHALDTLHDSDRCGLGTCAKRQMFQNLHTTAISLPPVIAGRIGGRGRCYTPRKTAGTSGLGHFQGGEGEEAIVELAAPSSGPLPPASPLPSSSSLLLLGKVFRKRRWRWPIKPPDRPRLLVKARFDGVSGASS